MTARNGRCRRYGYGSAAFTDVPIKMHSLKRLTSIGIPDTVVSYENDSKCGISGRTQKCANSGKKKRNVMRLTYITAMSMSITTQAWMIYVKLLIILKFLTK